MRLRTRRFVAVAVGSLALAACGTRLPDSAFLSARGGGPIVNPTNPNEFIDPNTGDVVPNPTTGPVDLSGNPLPNGNGGNGNPSSGATNPGVNPSTSVGPSGAPPVTNGKANYASDVGVTATTIKLGSVFSKGGIFGPDQFTPNFYGVQAFFADLNAHHGINGRTVILNSCDDGGDNDGNSACVSNLIDNEKIFAFVGSSVFKYGGAAYTSQKGVPDVGGEPIGNEYDQYQHLYNILGSNYPRDGHPGYKGKNYGTTELYQFLVKRQHMKVAAVVYYNQTDSERGASVIANGLRAVGVKVVLEPVNLAFPDWNAAVADMQANNVDSIFDALDLNANAAMCKAEEDNNFVPATKVSTISTWNNSVAEKFSGSPKCLNTLYVAGTVVPFNDTNVPIIAKFRQDMQTYESQNMPTSKLHEWAVEGYAAAAWITDAIASCGADVTRVCVEKFMNRPVDYNARGLFTNPRSFVPYNYPQRGGDRVCIAVAQWQGGASGRWVTRSNGYKECYYSKYYTYDVSK